MPSLIMAAYRRIPIHAEADFEGRRRVLKLMAASAALAGAGCSGPPAEPILPYVRAPEQSVPGQPVYYATSVVRNGYGAGVLVKNEMGRPIKVEGNPHHPASFGATDAQTQAMILQLWDPERSQLVMRAGEVSDWTMLEQALAPRRAAWQENGGAGLRILTGTVTSPTLAAQLEQLLVRYPAARWHQHDPLHDDAGLAAARLAFGRPVDFVLKPAQAEVIVSFDADFLGHGSASVACVREFVRGRSAIDPKFARRLYAVEACPSLTGIAADHRLALAPCRIEAMVARIGAHFEVCGAPASTADGAVSRWEHALIGALERHRGTSLVVGGGALGPEARAIILALNAKLGNMGRTLQPIAPVEARPESHAASMASLVADIQTGAVETLLMAEVNPVYDAPGALKFAQALRRVPCSVHLGLYRDETARVSTWHIPAAHNFEHWSDVRVPDGTAGIVQPVIDPLYGGRSVHSVLAWFNGEAGLPGQALVQRTWRRLRGDGGFDAFWAGALQQGVIDGSAASAMSLPALSVLPLPPDPPLARHALPAVFCSGAAIGAGELANNGWLQELPSPITGITWDNAVLIGPATARGLGLASGDIVRLGGDERAVEGPVWVHHGHAEGCLTVPLGYGRRAAGAVGNGVGFDAYPLRPRSGGPAWLTVTPTGRHHNFAVPQKVTEMEGRELARSGTVAEFRRNPHFAADKEKSGTLYPQFAYESYKWGMAIDLNACIGCGACSVACQAENNIPVVGKEEVRRGRIMHWIRVDRYTDGGGIFQPVPCMHCEDAPCEAVCPVGATQHDSEGINVQVYNRCVGTRFCSNNCPYKVRRFNFLQYASNGAADAARQNPEVTVRRRGVMEKCNYCLQRITSARLDAEQLGRPLRDGEVVTACQAVCPANAIVFGDLNDPASAVNRAKASPLNYALLGELNTRPRTSYAARVRNVDGGLA
ncbi:4Fe-4S dicluster domain-containing protein [Pseudoduganella sp. RAF19]|uniref:4Fe-4S dicluster domain-containing protein n=1 Tax=Pseudoduganella sp. RAF19 TaxID=3233052 RepID=UPI003F99B5E8